MPEQLWVTRICGLGADGAEVVRREVPDTAAGVDTRAVAAVAEWVSCLADVESVIEQTRRYY